MLSFERLRTMVVIRSPNLLVRHLTLSAPAAAKVVPRNLKGKTSSQQNWLTRQLNDPYVKMARYRNYRARSAFKLLELDDKYSLLQPGMTVVECGAAPGAWTQVLVERLQLGKVSQQLELKGMRSPKADQGRVISIDINAIAPVEGATVLPNLDFTSPIAQGRVLSLLDGQAVDLVCSDMAPNATGVATLDHEKQVALVYSALRFSIGVLRPQSGAFLTKIWTGVGDSQVHELLNKFFETVKLFKPAACHAESVETYIVARQFKGVKM